MLEDIIYQAIASYIPCEVLDVSGDGRHFDAIVVSSVFNSKSRIERHRIIYEALGDKMKDEVHALSMKLYTIDEWHKLKVMLHF